MRMEQPENLKILFQMGDLSRVDGMLSDAGISKAHFTSGAFTGPDGSSRLAQALEPILAQKGDMPIVVLMNSAPSLAKIPGSSQGPSSFEQHFEHAIDVAGSLAEENPGIVVAVLYFHEQSPAPLFRVLSSKKFGDYAVSGDEKIAFNPGEWFRTVHNGPISARPAKQPRAPGVAQRKPTGPV